MHVQTHSVFHTLFHPPPLVFWFTHPCPLLSQLNHKPMGNGLPFTHFIYDVISYTCCCKTHSPAKWGKNPASQSQSPFLSCRAWQIAMRKTIILVVQQECMWHPVKITAQKGVALMMEGTFQKTFMNNPITQMHTFKFYLIKTHRCPPFTYVYKMIYCRI